MKICVISDFFSTSTGSIGKKITQFYRQLGKIYRRNGKNIMIGVSVICFLKVNNI